MGWCRISDGVEAVLGERVNFNEVLSVMYREGQKMSWHDDGEEGGFISPSRHATRTDTT